MQRVGLDPDALYNQLLDTLETAPPTEPSPPSVSKVLNDGNVPDASQLQAMLARWILHKRDDFTPPLAELLERTSNTPNSPVTEQAVIEAIIDSPEWTATVIGLPAPADIRAALSVLGHSQAVDKNGAVPIGFLSPRAREIVERAHRLSQQCRCAGITHRLFLAAFVERIDGFAAKVCQQAGVDTSLLQSLLVTISGESKEAGDDAPPNVILSPEVCARIVSPVLAQARREAHDPENVSECELFRAFCRIADPRFQQFLRVRATTEELELTEADLSELMSIEPDKPDRLDRLTLRAREVVRTAHRLARERGIRSIPNRLMLAALLAEDESCACRLLEKRGLPARKLYDLLVASVEGGTASASDLDDETCARIVTPTIARARRLAASDGFVTERILFRAFCEDADPAFKTALAERGIDLDAIATGRTMLSEPGAWGPN
jgi:ATP-dependent Clp protease ATP-binding subunit ClpA